MNESSSRMADRRARTREKSSRIYAERRAQIIAAAATVFQELGYQRANFGEIATVCGLDRATLYYYFKDKEELLRDVTYSASLDSVNTLERLSAADLPAEEKLEQAIRLTLDNYEKYYPFPQLYLRDDVMHLADEELRDELVRLGRRYEKALTSILDDGVRSGELALPAESIATTMYAILGMLNWTSRWYRPGGKLPVSSIAATFAQILRYGILPRN